MACNERTINATPEQIWAVLSDPMCYDRWVVGAKDIRTADGTWPEADSMLDHTSGVGPLEVKDNTKVLESEPPHRLVMEARGRPVGIARIELRLEPVGSATKVTMIEEAVRPEAMKLANPALDPLIHSRNTETLRRLEEATHERLAAEAT